MTGSFFNQGSMQAESHSSCCKQQRGIHVLRPSTIDHRPSLHRYFVVDAEAKVGKFGWQVYVFTVEF
jgi:hypothetical protein